MNIDVTHIVSSIREIMSHHTFNLTAVEKSQYISTLLGSAIGASLDMPSAPVDIPRNFFLTNVSERATNILGCVNELIPINIDLALSIASNIYLARYRLVFEPAFTVHVLGHLATCTDDVVPGDISALLCKVREGKPAEDMGGITRVLCTAIKQC